MIRCRVKWEGPFTIEKVLEMGEADDFGVCQIYGRHQVFGPDCLLYIGMTVETFSDRLQTHCAQWLLVKGTPWYQNRSDVSIRTGRLWLNPVPYRENLDILKDVERFEIFCHYPPFNSSNVSSYNEQPLSVLNDGEAVGLLTCISTEELTHNSLRFSVES